MPKDDRRTDWINAISPHVNMPNVEMLGMLCSEHFHDTDFFKNSKTNRLKKKAIPSVFEKSDEANCADKSANSSELELNVEEQLNECVESGQEGNNEWHRSYLNEKADRNIEVQRLTQRIKSLEHKVQVHKKHIKYLEQKLRRENATKESLQSVLADLNAEKLLDEENLKKLKASDFRIF